MFIHTTVIRKFQRTETVTSPALMDITPDRDTRESQAVVLPLGYLLEPPVKVTVKGKQVEVQPNSRLPSREGIEWI
jgi:hypothetical protein